MYRLVVIDDEYIVVQGIKALISRLKLDYEVVGAAYDGIQGLEVIRSEKPDVVITDIRIPGLQNCSHANDCFFHDFHSFLYSVDGSTLI